MTPQQLVDELRQSLPDALRAVVLYGSAAAGDFIPGASHHNILVVVQPLSVRELDALIKPAAAWARAGNGPPMLFTPEQLANSADAFPIEFLDIQQSHTILFGENPLAGIQVRSTHLRLQLERELKGKLLALRHHYLLTEKDPERILDLLVNSLSTFLVLLRAALRLYQSEVPIQKTEALAALTKHLKFNPEPLLAIQEIKAGKRPRDPSRAGTLFEQYLTTLSQVIDSVDRHIHAQGEGAIL